MTTLVPEATTAGFVVVKLGGRAFDDDAGRRELAAAVAALRTRGVHPVVVHGGGVQVTRALDAAGIEARFVDGLRVTTPEALAVAERVFTTLGKELAHALTNAGAPALALTGRDAGLLQATPREAALGRVGAVTHIAADVLRFLAFNGLTPVVSPIAAAPDGGVLNVNADEVSAAVARGLGARELILLTDVPGVRGADGAVVPDLDAAGARALVANGVAAGGMVPKLLNAVAAVEGGVKSVRIMDGGTAAALSALASGATVGTRIVAEAEA